MRRPQCSHRQLCGRAGRGPVDRRFAASPVAVGTPATPTGVDAGVVDQRIGALGVVPVVADLIRELVVFLP